MSPDKVSHEIGGDEGSSRKNLSASFERRGGKGRRGEEASAPRGRDGSVEKKKTRYRRGAVK